MNTTNRKEGGFFMQKNQKGTVVHSISSLDTDVKKVFFVCPEWRKTIKACGKNRENKLKAERRTKNEKRGY